MLQAIREMSADPTPFPASAQYQKNMTVGDDDAAGPEGEKTQVRKKGKAGKKKKKAANKKSKGKCKRQASKKHQKLKHLATACNKQQKKKEPIQSPVSTSASYKAGDFCCARDRYLERTRRLLRVNWQTANAMWKQSAERASYLRTLSLPELKRRRFVPAGTTSHPFL